MTVVWLYSVWPKPFERTYRCITMKEKAKPTVTKVVTIKKGGSSVVVNQQLEPTGGRLSARDRLDGVLEAERFRLSSLVARDVHDFEKLTLIPNQKV